MGTKIYGIGAAENRDNSGELLLIDGMDTSKLRYITDEHGEDAWSIIGAINYHKKIYSIDECEDDHQRRCWNHAKVPFLFYRAELADDSGHPNAQAAAALLKFTAARPDLPLKVGGSIEGGIVERSGPDEKTLKKTLAVAVAATVKPCNPMCVTFLENDLAKSDLSMEPPQVYYEALKKSQSTRSFIEQPGIMLYMYLETLKKSFSDYIEGFTSLKCHHCGEGVRFFKSSKDVPNRCSSCGSAFRLSDIWSAMNK